MTPHVTGRSALRWLSEAGNGRQPCSGKEVWDWGWWWWWGGCLRLIEPLIQPASGALELRRGRILLLTDATNLFWIRMRRGLKLRSVGRLGGLQIKGQHLGSVPWVGVNRSSMFVSGSDGVAPLLCVSLQRAVKTSWPPPSTTASRRSPR